MLHGAFHRENQALISSSAAVWLCYVTLYYRCSSVSSVSVHNSQKTLSDLWKLFRWLQRGPHRQYKLTLCHKNGNPFCFDSKRLKFITLVWWQLLIFID